MESILSNVDFGIPLIPDIFDLQKIKKEKTDKLKKGRLLKNNKEIKKLTERIGLNKIKLKRLKIDVESDKKILKKLKTKKQKLKDKQKKKSPLVISDSKTHKLVIKNKEKIRKKLESITEDIILLTNLIKVREKRIKKINLQIKQDKSDRVFRKKSNKKK